MSFMNFLSRAAPIAATVLGSPALGAVVGAGAGMLGARQQAKAQERAGQQAAEHAYRGFDYLSGSPLGTQYLPAGGQALTQQAALLGLGGDPAAAQAAYQNYLQSTGFQGALDAGSQAITGNAAARGLLGSGSTARRLTEYGHQLGQQAFGNYFNQLGGMAGMGLQAGGVLGNAAMAGGLTGAQLHYGAGMNAADSRAHGFDQLMGGLGGALDIYQSSRGGASPNRLAPAVMQNVPDNYLRNYG